MVQHLHLKGRIYKTRSIKKQFQISSGDDMFILKAFLKCKECVVKPLISKGIYVLTDGPKIYEIYFRGVRWSSKMRFIKLPLINLIGIFILCVIFMSTTLSYIIPI